MKIGIMLRHLGQHGGGVLVYTNQLLRELVELDTPHEYVFMYREPRFLGTYARAGKVREVAISAPTVLLWDQMAVRRLAEREKLDLVFNPKYSVPLAVGCRTVFVCHGLDWYVMPWGSRWIDRLSHRFLVPRYARKADRIVADSDTVRDHVLHYLHVDGTRVDTVYPGVSEQFGLTVPRERLEEVRREYGLPQRFFLYCGQIYPPKNFGRLLRAFSRVGPELGIFLVAAGEPTWLYRRDLALIEELGLSRWVIRPGWVDHQTLPTFYRLADALLLPSLYEGCPLPLLEAMASGCPVLTANRFGCAELAEPAGVLVDPESVDSIADGMRRVAESADLRRQLADRGRERARSFTWRRTAEQVQGVLDRALVGSG